MALFPLISLFVTIHLNSSFRTHESAGCAPGALLFVCEISREISLDIQLLCYDDGAFRTKFHAEAASLAALLIDFDMTFHVLHFTFHFMFFHMVNDIRKKSLRGMNRR
jgi:hypothetical protein